MGKYKFGKPDQEIELQDFKQRLSKSKLSLRKKAYLVLLYWLGCRRSEPLVILKEDIEEREGNLFISIHYRLDENGERILYSRAKRGQAGGPIELPLSYFGVDLIKEAWEKTKKGKRVFPFCDKTGYRAVLNLWKEKTPHWLRYNRVTKLRKMLGTKTTIDGIKSFTGIKRDTTIQNYGLKTKADIHKIAELLE
jgi:integrase